MSEELKPSVDAWLYENETMVVKSAEQRPDLVAKGYVETPLTYYRAQPEAAPVEKVARLEAENERLREALEPFTFREDGDDEAVSIQHPSIIVRCEVTYGDIQLARAALEGRHD